MWVCVPWVEREETVQRPPGWALVVQSSDNVHYAAQAFLKLRHVYVLGVCCDQLRAPIAADVKRSLREKAKLEGPTFALTADISEAPIDARDWHYLGCQVTPGSVVYVHTVGTFGIASASYYWSRVSTAVGRLSQYLAGHDAHTWHLLVADHYHLDAGGRAHRGAVMVVFILCAVVGVPPA